MKFFIIDDDEISIDIQADFLEDAGHTVSHETVSENALARVKAERPDCVITDLMMPGIDGYQMLKQIKESEDLKDVKVIVVSSKAFEYDQKQVLELGADGFISKPVSSESYLTAIDAIINDKIKLSYWGVRGTLPVAGERAYKYGGNTSCVSLEFTKNRMFIFDGGSGIKELSNFLFAQGRTKLEAKIFISHPHWDHINALPLFPHMYIPGNDFEILGAGHVTKSMREIISAQMDDVYFPITIKEFGARVYFRDISEGEYEISGISVKTILLSHPGWCLGYRIDYNGGSVCYVTDNELFLPDAPNYNAAFVNNLTKFLEGTDILIIDCTYSDEEYPKKVGWGHSCVSQVVGLADAAKVKHLHLFHHDPDQDDAAIDRKLESARDQLAKLGSEVSCIAPRETESFSI